MIFPETEMNTMARTKYVLSLSEQEYSRLQEIIRSEDTPERAVLRAKILLMSDKRRDENLSVLELAEKLNTTHTTIQTVRTEYAAGGLEAAVFRKQRTPGFINKRINDEVIEKILNLAKEVPPEGKKRWSVRLLCAESVKRGIVTHIAPSTMSVILKNSKEKKE